MATMSYKFIVEKILEIPEVANKIYPRVACTNKNKKINLFVSFTLDAIEGLYLSLDLTLHYPSHLQTKSIRYSYKRKHNNYSFTKKCVVAWKVFKKTSKKIKTIFISRSTFTLHCPVNIKLKKGQQHHFVLGSNVFTFQSFCHNFN